MREIYDPTLILQNEIKKEIGKIKDMWQLRQIQRYIANIQKETSIETSKLNFVDKVSAI